MKLGLYIHVPFCISKCNYCDFLSFGGSSEAEQEAYAKSLCREIEYYGKTLANSYVVDTIFIGGGTPSLLSPYLIKKIMICINEKFNLEKGAEITLEANPKTLTEEKLKLYLESGINRLSLGVQSLNDDVLYSLGRLHNTADFMDNFNLARKCGFRNINMDLMFAVPGHTMELWQDTLERAVRLSPEHISFYSLQLEENTPFFDMFERGELELPSDILDREMYYKAIGLMQSAGYNHYEISNMAKPGYECRHNLKYWSMEEYLGFGLGAHSYLQGCRFNNVIEMKSYLKATENTVGMCEGWVAERHENTRKDDMSEYVFTGLRRMAGINLTDFRRRFGDSIFGAYKENIAAINDYINNGYLITDANYLKLSIKGIDISNIILSEFV